MTRWPKTRRVALVILGTAVLLELILQAGAGFLWLTADQEAVPDGPVVLCVGDSWTFGDASSNPAEKSYPAQLEDLLAAAVPGAGWAVVNRGVRGHDSRDVLRKLPSQLSRYEPRYVYILVGQNDAWSRPARLDVETEAVDETAFRWTWRTWRFTAWFAGKLAKRYGRDPRPQAEPELVRGGRPLGSGLRQAADPPRVPAAWDEQARAWKAWAAGARNDAAVRFERAIELNPEAAKNLGALVELYAEMGETEKSREALRRLEAGYAAKPTVWKAEALLWALQHLRDNEGIHRWAEKLAAAHPESAAVWTITALDRQRHGRQKDAEQAANRILGRGATPEMLLWRLKVFLTGERLHEAVRSVILRYMLEGDESQAIADLRLATWKVPKPTWDLVVAEADVSDAQRAALERVGSVAYADGGGEVARVFEDHLTQMVELCRARGAEPVLLSYAQPVAEMRDARRAVAAAAGVGLLDLKQLLLAVEEHAWRDFFATEGHFNDLGYGYVARFVADDLLARLEKAPR